MPRDRGVGYLEIRLKVSMAQPIRESPQERAQIIETRTVVYLHFIEFLGRGVASNTPGWAL